MGKKLFSFLRILQFVLMIQHSLSMSLEIPMKNNIKPFSKYRSKKYRFPFQRNNQHFFRKKIQTMKNLKKSKELKNLFSFPRALQELTEEDYSRRCGEFTQEKTASGSTNSKKTCKKCRSGYFLDPSDNFCKDCSSDPDDRSCKECTPEKECLKCNVGYFSSNPSKKIVCTACQEIIPECQACSSDGKSCLVCSYEYVISEDKKSCIPKLPCSSDKISASCQSCSESGLKCIKCLDGLVPSQDGLRCQCSPTLDYCEICQQGDPKICVRCQEGYNLSEDAHTCSKGAYLFGLKKFFETSSVGVLLFLLALF